MSEINTTDILMKEWHKRICETDAAWETFCKFPTDGTWSIYTEALEAEQMAEERYTKEKSQVTAQDFIVKTY